MPPVTRDSDVLTAPVATGVKAPATPGRSEDGVGGKPQPVALEIPVTVNGARTVEGSDKREPFSEATKTVLVFGTGAVIRLSSAVEAGQLLFLTNEKTKKEVVCQVVKSKNYRNVSGYVELEFTEAVVGFWGMRFPGDRVAPQPVAAGPAGAASAKQVEFKPAPPTPVKPSPVPVAVAPVLTVPAISPAAKKEVVEGTPKPAAEVPAKHDAPAALADTLESLGALLAASAAPGKPSAEKEEPATERSSTEALRLETERLQEQLSSLLFANSVAAPATKTPAAKAPAQESAAGMTAKLVELAKPEAAALRPVSVTPAKEIAAVQPVPAKSLLDVEEEVKIPSWLEPLARNAAVQSTASADAQEAASAIAEPPVREELAESAVPDSSPRTNTKTPMFGGALLDNGGAEQQASGGSKKLLVGLAVAAGLLLAVAGGAWYHRQSTPAPSGSAQPAPPVTAPSNPSPSAAQNASAMPATESAAANSGSSSSLPPGGTASPVNAVSNTQAAVQPAALNAVTREVERIPAAASARPGSTAVQPAPQPLAKKPALGEVRLATPKASRKGTQTIAAGEPNIADDSNSTIGAAALTGLSTGGPKAPPAPVAPPPIGGDVRPAQLVSSVRPSYPILAKSQHVSGDVKVDALIDANGNVTTMRILSGPTLLHQAAMDALRQWKYRPASLNGSPTPTHLAVTIQFRLQ